MHWNLEIGPLCSTGSASDARWIVGEISPKDLDQALPQQNLLLRLAQTRSEHTLGIPQTTGIWGWDGTDVQVCRYGARWRVAEWGSQLGFAVSDELKDAMIPKLESAGVLGCMPNIPANRIELSCSDCQGASGTISAEENSGLMALEQAMDALRRGEDRLRRSWRLSIVQTILFMLLVSLL